MATVSTQLSGFIPASTLAPVRDVGFFARIIQLLQDARMRQAEREVGRLIEARGGRLTDDVERQITRHFV